MKQSGEEQDGKHIFPGVMWIHPRHEERVEDQLHFAATVYPNYTGEAAIDHIDLTISTAGVWQVASTIRPLMGGTFFTDAVSLKELNLPAGPLQISFDVYDTEGNVNKAPYGVRTIHYTPDPIAWERTSATQGLSSGNPLQTRQPPDRCDLLLVTATKVDTQAVLKRLWQQERRDPFRCYAGSNTYLDLGTIGGARTLLVQSGQGAMGADGAMLIVQEGIRTFSPSAVMVLGITFGLRPDKQSLGDIIVSSQLRAYEAQRIGTDIHGKLQIILRGPRADASPYLLDKFRIGQLDWSEIRVHTGLFLSGEKLIDHEGVRDHLLSLEPEAIAGDMEGAGLYGAAYPGGGIADSRQKRVSTPFIYKDHAGWILTLDWEQKGPRIASAGGDGTVRVWDAQTGHTLRTYRHTGMLSRLNFEPKIYTVAWSLDGQWIASAGTGSKVHVWDTLQGETSKIYTGHRAVWADVFALCWSPDGTLIASGCSGTGSDNSIHIWEVATGHLIQRCRGFGPFLDGIYGIAWSPDGLYVAAVGGQQRMHVWLAKDGRHIATCRLPGDSQTLAWAPKQTRIAVGTNNHKAIIWDMKSERVLLTYGGHKGSVRDIAWSPDGTRLATASNDKTAHVWDAATGARSFTYTNHREWVTSIAWSPNGERIASGSNDRTVHIWRPE